MKRKLPKLWQLKRFIQWGYKSSGYPKRLDCFELLGFAQQFKRSKKQSHIFPADSLKDAFYRENITSHRQRIQLLIMGFMPTRLPRLLGRLGKCEKIGSKLLILETSLLSSGGSALGIGSPLELEPFFSPHVMRGNAWVPDEWSVAGVQVGCFVARKTTPRIHIRKEHVQYISEWENNTSTNSEWCLAMWATQS